MWRVCVALFVLCFSLPALAETRLALVIGNASYQHVTPLANAVNDANLIATSLKAQGFGVDLYVEVDLKSLKRALTAFFGRVEKAGKDAVIVVYYAGHGVQVGGSNYLIPIDAQIDKEGDVDIEAVKADSIMSMIAYSGSPLNIIILDACRNNPFRGFRSASRGLAQIEAPSGTLVAFSTAPGKVARDGPKKGNSPYTAVLAKTLAEPGITIEDVFKRVRKSVNTETNGDQVPWESSSLIGDFYPAGRQEAAVSAPSAAPVNVPAAIAKPEPPMVASAAPMPPPRAAKPKVDAALSVKPGSGESFRDTLSDGQPCTMCPEMVVAPSGSFLMGDSETEFDAIPSRDHPAEKFFARVDQRQYNVKIPKMFAVGRYTVTFDEWDACVADGGCSHKPGDGGWGRGNRPVINVSWEDISKEYLPWLNKKSGQAYRLLSESEREYVTRAGTKTSFWWGTSISPQEANYNGSAEPYAGEGVAGVRFTRRQTLPVNSFKPNPWGLFNVHGNVVEWTQDCWNTSNKDTPRDGTAQMMGDCSQRVVRNGSWISDPQFLRSARRDRYPTEVRSEVLGFRVGRTLP